MKSLHLYIQNYKTFYINVGESTDTNDLLKFKCPLPT